MNVMDAFGPLLDDEYEQGVYLTTADLEEVVEHEVDLGSMDLETLDASRERVIGLMIEEELARLA